MMRIIRTTRTHWWRLALVCLSLAASRLAFAHEFWITVGALNTDDQLMRLVVGFGEQFPRPLPLSEGDSVAIRLFGADGNSRPVTQAIARDGEHVVRASLPAALEPGLYSIEATLDGKTLTYSGADFQAYLTREHLASALQFRRALQEEQLPARETVSMFAKCVVRIGATTDAVAPVLGSKLELVPVGDPTRIRAGDTLHVRVRFNNGVQADTPVNASGYDGSTISGSLTGRTNSAGEVDFVLPSAGVWLMHTVLTLPGSARRGEPTEWRSYWASLTVNVNSR